MTHRAAFSLAELMVSVMVFTIGVVALMGVYLSVAQISESSRNLARAMADARVVLEGIRETSTAGLPAVTVTNWTTWASNGGLTSLNNESMTVTYANPAADPLAVTVQVNWQERGRARSASVATLVTRR